MISHTKTVGKKEFHFTKLASKHNIGTTLVDLKELDDGMYSIKLELWPKTLHKESIWIPYRTAALQAIKKLHSIGIFHGNISEENIVVNPSNKEVRLIEFGLSKYISDLTKQDMEKWEDYLERAPPGSTLLEAEINEMKWLFKHNL